MINGEQMVFLGNPEFVCDLGPIDFTKVAEGCGLRAHRIDDPARCAGQLREALATPGPCLIEAVVDPHEPPKPPKVEAQQALQSLGTRRKGTPNARQNVLTITSDKVTKHVGAATIRGARRSAHGAAATTE